LSRIHKKDVESIQNQLKNIKCGERSIETEEAHSSTTEKSKPNEETIEFRPIGYIHTIFNEKRALPKQANLAQSILSKIVLNRNLFSNTEHSLEGLEEYSHFWIIYHFHKNESHPKPKIFPPRLGGKNIGVFATRSPHRPNSIGLSLVQFDHIDDLSIYFYGVDMLDRTPVIDLKPYIPSYDSPQKIIKKCESESLSRPKREEPEGEEEEEEAQIGAKSHASVDVKVPKWVSENKIFTVVFTENSLTQIAELGVNQKSIEEILQSDPRSVYVREKYLSQIYNFQIDGKNVICKFDDKHSTVIVLQVKNLMEMSTE
jgi:tRNA-Thr(GGU) m(6)t(6)A37 methyltransferase TsaA